MPDESQNTPFVYQPPRSPWLEVLHTDRDMVVVNKPGGLLSVPGRGPGLEDSILSRVQERVPGALVVHRLDMDTSGVMVVATRRKAERELRRQFREKLVEKVYLAEVWGTLHPDQGTVDLPIGPATSEHGPRNRVDHDNGRAALTHFEVIERRPDTTLVRLHPVTGRSHQLRVHMLALGHPIVGDRFYGPASRGHKAGMHLHAQSLTVLHPFSGEPATFTAPPPFR